jgi:hypothetical protein
MLGRQQRLILLILLVEKDQQELQMGKTITITKRNICIHMHWEVELDLSELFSWTIFVVLLGLLCLTDLTVDSNDITVLFSGEQKHYFHLWGLQKPLVIFSVPTRENNVFYSPSTAQ